MVAAFKEKKRVKALSNDPTREYIAGGSLIGNLNQQVLAASLDEVLRTQGADTYDRMMHDPKVAGSVSLIVDAVLADQLQLIPAIMLEDKSPDPEAAAERDFCQRSLNGLRKPFKQTLAMMLKGALKYGNKIAEKNLKIGMGDDRGRYVLESIKVKPRNAVRFVVDPFMNLQGFVANKVTDKGIRTISFSSFASPDDLIERDKCAVLTLNQEDEDPRGNSSLRPSFTAWNLKNRVWPQFLLWLMCEAIPGLIAILSKDAGNEAELNESGEVVKDESGNVQTVTASQAALNTLQQFRSAFAAVFPHETKIEKIESKSEGGAFKNSIELLNGEITEGILFQKLATSEGEHQARAAAQSHMTVLDLLIFWLKGVVEDMIYTDILKPLMRVNVGEEKAELLTPKVSLGDTERRNFEATLVAYSKAYRDGLIFKSQLPAIHAELGLTPATPEELGQTNQPPVKEEAKGATA